MNFAASNYRSGTASYAVRAAVGIALGTAAMMAFSPQVSAAGADELEEVQVTGSRITRKDLVSNSPLVSVDASVLESRAGLNIESYLNQLPEFNPAASPTTTQGDVQISAVNSVGIATVSLRGFGANRTLTLIDGRRATPINALQVVDINGIPSSMIKRVEIISGGASATYGADAMGGVSNFMLRRDFQGLEVDSQYGVTAAGDGAEVRASAIMGTKVADNRGNIVIATEYYDRKGAYTKNRDFYTKGWADPTTGGNFIGFIFGVNGANQLFNPGNATTMAALTGKTPTTVYGFGGTGVFGGVRFNPDGSLFVPSVTNNKTTFGKPIDGSNYALQNIYDGNRNIAAGDAQVIQQIKYNDIYQYASAPQTRYSFMASGDYDITDHIKFSSSARFAQSRTKTFLAGTNASFGWEATIPYNPVTDSPVVSGGTVNGIPVDWKTTATLNDYKANPAAYANAGFKATGTAGASHPVSSQYAILLNSRANPTGSWVLETYPDQGFKQRSTDNQATVWQIEAAVKFDVPVKDWTGEVYYSRGESETYNVAFGDNSLARWRGVVQSTDYGRNGTFQSNLNFNGPGASAGFGSVAAKCTSGFYDTIFAGDKKASADCLYAVEANLQTSTRNQQDIVELNFQGGLFSLPAGEVRSALGYQSRRNAAQFNPDILQSTASFTDQVIGVYPTGYLDSQTTVKDYFGELLVPVLSDLPFLKKLELELGGRYSDYNATASTTTFKVNASAEINDYVRFRGGFNRATRAPNLGELYLNLQQVFTGGGTFGDPCGVLSNSPFGAGGAYPNYNATSSVTSPATLASGQTAAGATSAYLICRAQMTSAAQLAFYGTSTTAATQGPPAAGGGGFAWVNQQGNPTLKSESADTWTAGVVLRSPFESAWLRGLTATFDWYQIGIKDAIEPYSIDYARWLCYGAVTVTDATGAAAQAATAACQNLPRNAGTGGSVSTLLQYANQAKVSTSGVDFGINWVGNLSELGLASIPGSVGMNVSGTYLDYYKTKLSPASYDVVTDWKGSLGPTMPGFNSGAYSYRLFTSLSYMLPAFSVNLRWRHLPQVAPTAKASEDAIVANNARVTAGGPGTLLSYTPTTAAMVPAYDMFDLSFNWNLNDTLSVRGGINNLFDKDPAITGKTYGYPVVTQGVSARVAYAAVCAGRPGCQVPTSYSLGSTGQGTTSGGYYDVLGRSYFIGLKAKF